MRKLIYIFGLAIICTLIAALYRKFNYSESYPNGNIKKRIVFQVLEARFQFKEYYEDGQLKKVSYVRDNKMNGPVIEYFPSGKINSIGRYENDLRKGDFLIYREDGMLYVLNKYKEGKNYYRKKYIYNSAGMLKDSAYSMQPIIYYENRSADSIYYKVGVITEGLNISCDSLDLFYELYEYKAYDGRLPYTPSNIALLKDCRIQNLQLSTKPDMINYTDTKSDSLYFFVVVRDKVKAKLHENDPLIIAMKK